MLKNEIEKQKLIRKKKKKTRVNQVNSSNLQFGS